jgi:hypothetical protein
MPSKRFGTSAYEMEIVEIEGLIMSPVLLILPLIVLAIQLQVLPGWEYSSKDTTREATT